MDPIELQCPHCGCKVIEPKRVLIKNGHYSYWGDCTNCKFTSNGRLTLEEFHKDFQPAEFKSAFEANQAINEYIEHPAWTDPEWCNKEAREIANKAERALQWEHDNHVIHITYDRFGEAVGDELAEDRLLKLYKEAQENKGPLHFTTSSRCVIMALRALVAEDKINWRKVALFYYQKLMYINQSGATPDWPNENPEMEFAYRQLSRASLFYDAKKMRNSYAMNNKRTIKD